jgi:hypothetical protein
MERPCHRQRGANNTNTWRMVFDEANAEAGIHGRKIK